MSKLRVNTIVNRTSTDKVTFPFGIGVTNGVICSGVVTATSFVGSGVSLTGVQGTITLTDSAANNTVSGVTTIRVGTGLSHSSSGSGVAVINTTNVFGIATITQLQATTVNASGIVTASSFSGPLAGNVTGSLNSTGVSTAAFLQATTVNVSAAATIPTLTGTTATFTNITANGGFTGQTNSSGVGTVAFLQATNVNVSAAATIPTLTGTTATFTNITANGGYTGKINSSGVSTITQLVASTINVSGVVTATNGFAGPLTGQVNGNLIGEINSTGISTLGRISVTSINQASGISTIPQLKSDTISITGVATASSFVGNVTGTSTGLSGTPDIYVGFVTSKTHLPQTDNSHDLGSSSVRWANIYTADMQIGRAHV